MKGVLLVNLGSPESPSPKDVKTYLGEFLMDERVVDLPKLFRTILVKGIILNTRPKQSARAYKKIWWDEGSPLIVLSERLKGKVSEKVSTPVSLAMRYGSMSIKKGLQELVDQGVDDIFIIPLYPQFAMATTETILVLAEELRDEFFPQVKFTSLPAFYNHPDYVRVLSNSIAEGLQGKNWEHLLFSYHGVPERHIRKSDITKSHCKINGECCVTASNAHEFCYRHQCYENTRLVAEYLELKEGTFSTSFQSRLGVDQWLQPYTDKTLEAMPGDGIKHLAVICPGFSSVCLETFEEIDGEGREIFTEHGGETFHYIPCLNSQPLHLEALAGIVSKYL
jgi:ferrochelatase